MWCWLVLNPWGLLRRWWRTLPSSSPSCWWTYAGRGSSCRVFPGRACTSGTRRWTGNSSLRDCTVIQSPARTCVGSSWWKCMWTCGFWQARRGWRTFLWWRFWAFICTSAAMPPCRYRWTSGLFSLAPISVSTAALLSIPAARSPNTLCSPLLLWVRTGAADALELFHLRSSVWSLESSSTICGPSQTARRNAVGGRFCHNPWGRILHKCNWTW